MLKGKELLDYTLNKINRKSKFEAIMELSSHIIDLDEKHKKLLLLANKIDAYEYLFEEIMALENLDEVLKKYIEEHNYPAPIRWGWKHLRIFEDKEDLIDECEWFEDRHECYRSMWKNMRYTAENAIEMSCECPLTVTSKSGEWFKLESDGLVYLFTIYEIK